MRTRKALRAMQRRHRGGGHGVVALAMIGMVLAGGCKSGKRAATFAAPPGEITKVPEQRSAGPTNSLPQAPGSPTSSGDARGAWPVGERPVAKSLPLPSDMPRGVEGGIEVWWWTIDEHRGDPRTVIVSKGEVKPLDDDQARVITRLGLRIVKDDSRLVTLRSEGGEDLTRLTSKQIAGLSAVGLRPVALSYTTIDERLAKYVDRATPLEPDLADMWRLAGLRVLAVPVDDLRAIQESLPLKGEANHQWLGEMHEWGPLVVGPSSPGGMRALIPGGMLELPPGRFRLLSRCWMVPRAGDGEITAQLRLELVPQHEEGLSSRQRWTRTAGLDQKPGVGDQGLVLDRLRASMLLDGREALLLIPQGPSTGHADQDAALSGAPIVAPAPTLGEALLASGQAGTIDARSRVVIALVPRVPARLRLLP